MATITLEVGDIATPVVDVVYIDPTTNVEITVLTNGVPGVVVNRVQNDIDLETQETIYTYNIQFTPPIVTPFIVPDVKQPDGSLLDEERTITNDVFWFDNADLGLAPPEELPVDLIAWQQEVNESKQISSSAVSSVQSARNSVLQDDISTISFGKQEILNSVSKMESNDANIQGSDVLSHAGEEQYSEANRNRVGSTLLGNDQQLYAEYVDNLFATRDILKERDAELKSDIAQSAEDTARGFADDTADTDSYITNYLSQTTANVFTEPTVDPDYEAIQAAKEERLLENYQQAAENVGSTLLNPPTVAFETPAKVEVQEDYPITPPGTEE